MLKLPHEEVDLMLQPPNKEGRSGMQLERVIPQLRAGAEECSALQ